MNGFLVVDKPGGMTSHDVVARARRLLKVRRIGHLGTLDPLATGVLPLAVGIATRLVEFLGGDDKAYVATLKLGEETDTQDAEGRIIATAPVPILERDEIERVFSSFLGRIRQQPPMFSAVKIGGTPLYRLARKGIEVARADRQVEIHHLEITSIDLPHISFAVECSKGTYVRTLCRDLGAALGSPAHLTALRRTRSGIFSLSEAIGLEVLEEQAARCEVKLLPLEEGVRNFPRLEVAPEARLLLGHGVPPPSAAVPEAGSCREGEIVALMGDSRLLAMARFAPRRLLENRGDFELLRVFIPA
ncbi:MAG: tRNA pseudouridine(55) synthase TruB [Desulfuromonadaceae bacterium]|nr:tRNA pseudouridine(55) synthase TruB [Desulfuromonadaceae bacterium]